MAIDKTTEIIEALAQNELNVAELYRKYAAKFTEHKDFWRNLAIEELNHAAKLRTLTGVKVELKTKDRFNIIAIKNFSKHVLVESDPVKVNNSSLINALSTALNIEQSLIEHKYFEVFESDSIELKQVLLSLANDTEKHLENVRLLWAKQGH
jgi:hypothetical protein